MIIQNNIKNKKLKIKMQYETIFWSDPIILEMILNRKLSKTFVHFILFNFWIILKSIYVLFIYFLVNAKWANETKWHSAGWNASRQPLYCDQIFKTDLLKSPINK